MKYLQAILIAFAFFSCRHINENFNYNTSVASKVYEAQLKYLDITIGPMRDFQK
jgi:hypothetical protein